jgi:bifunctional non-homologous end joining protein LigD
MSLAAYKTKRNFATTKEPAGSKEKKAGFRFVVQRHDASHLHYDFRLELGGVLKSWAVPKGPPVKAGEKRLAVMTEDHPVDYIHFEGVIPKGNYGAGRVKIWDRGLFQVYGVNGRLLADPTIRRQLRQGELSFFLEGKKLKGEYVLVRMKETEKNWLLIKKKSTRRSVAKERITVSSRQNKTDKPVRVKKFISPMMASAVKEPFDDPDWLFEIKWDGYRAIAETGKNLAFYSRNGQDFRKKFKDIATALEQIKTGSALDGEVVALDEKGIARFQLLQQAADSPGQELLYYVFDLLRLNGKSIMDLPLLQRKELLKNLLGKHPLIRYCDHVRENGIAFFAAAKKEGLEGILAKQCESSYEPGYRTRQWLKIKTINTTEALIAGYTAPRGNRPGFGALVLAGKKGKEYFYRGHAGTGFSGKVLTDLKRKMDKFKAGHSPFTNEVPLNAPVTWLRPELVAEIGYGEITKDGLFRHPVFLRLRDDKDQSMLNEEIPVQMAKKNNAPVFTNEQKVYWPDEGYTKGDLISYYEKMASFILPHLKGRPLSLNRYPNGIKQPGFFHKDAGEKVPSFVDVFKVKSESSDKVIDYIVCNNKSTLLYLANLGCIDMNPWNSTTRSATHPSWMVIDIDPSPKNSFTQVVDVALATHAVLTRAKVDCYCKTSGATGLHVYVPLNNKYDYEQSKGFAQLVATLVHEELPAITTLERPLARRRGRIYIDYLQNRIGQTLASVYSVRPVAGAPVSTPLQWKEVKHSLDPARFTIENTFRRVEKQGDLFKPVIGKGISIEKTLRMLEK